MAKETVPKTLLVAGALSVVCSAFVAYSAVALRPLQEKNKALDRKKNILQSAGLYKEGTSIDDAFKKFDAKVVDLSTGMFIEDKDSIDPDKFNQRKAAKSSDQGIAIAQKDDLAGIKRRSKYAVVYIAKDDKGALTQLIIPVNGKGLWSTLYGYLALQKDLSTIDGFVFYEHGETPGLGGEVDNPKWKAQWIGKKVFDKEGNRKIEVIKGKVDPKGAEQQFQIDGLAGATITARGVSDLLDYWLGENAFKPLLDQLKSSSNQGEK